MEKFNREDYDPNEWGNKTFDGLSEKELLETNWNQKKTKKWKEKISKSFDKNGRREKYSKMQKGSAWSKATPMLGKHHSAKSKEKIKLSQPLLGKKLEEAYDITKAKEIKRKISLANTGKKRSKAFKEHLSKINKGVTKTRSEQGIIGFKQKRGANIIHKGILYYTFKDLYDATGISEYVYKSWHKNKSSRNWKAKDIFEPDTFIFIDPNEKKYTFEGLQKAGDWFIEYSNGKRNSFKSKMDNIPYNKPYICKQGFWKGWTFIKIEYTDL